MKRFVCTCLLALVGLCVALTTDAGAKPPIRIRKVTADKQRVKVYERVTFDVEIEGEIENPFDSGEFALDAGVTSPDGAQWAVPGFYYVPYEGSTSNKADRRTSVAGPGGWKVRLSFPEPGRYYVRVVGRSGSGKGGYLSTATVIHAEPADVPGMIRRHKTDHRYFVTDRGETWFAVGANVCWGETWGAGGDHVFAYDKWFPRYSENDCNYARLWLSLEWNDLALITTKSGYDRIDLQRAWHVDHVLELAEKYGIALMFSFDAHGMLRNKNRQHGFWEMSPLHPDNGAPIKKPIEFFTNEKMLDAYRDRLRYIVARYGYSSSVFSWEFFNEVDLIDDYDSKLVAEWHKNMAAYLRSIDPWKHLISTSYARHHGDPAVDGLKELDYVQTHHYQAKDITQSFAYDIQHKTAAKDRPHFHGEFGINHSGSETAKIDPKGIHLHNGLYSSPGQMHAGTPMSWWWDSYIHPHDMYYIYGAFSRWIEGYDFIEQNPEPVDAEFAWTKSKPDSGFAFTPGEAAWRDAITNTPLEVTIGRDGRVDCFVKPSAILHGRRNHPGWHNPVKFKLNPSRAGKFIVEVGDVSGHGGAILQISLDGKEVLRREFADPDANKKTDTLKRYRGDYSIDLPAGEHTVKVACVGNDWIMIDGYRVTAGIEAAAPDLRAYGLVGKDRALVWVQNPLHTWIRAAKPNYKPQPITDTELIIRNLKSGRWILEHWDSHSGKVTTTEDRIVSTDGVMKIQLPEISWDAAFRLRR